MKNLIKNYDKVTVISDRRKKDIVSRITIAESGFNRGIPPEWEFQRLLWSMPKDLAVRILENQIKIKAEKLENEAKKLEAEKAKNHLPGIFNGGIK